MPYWSKFAIMLTLLLCSTALTDAQVRQHSDLPQGISPSWWQQVQHHIRQSEYHISKLHDGRYTSPNRAQNLRFVYEPNGFCATRRDSLAHLWQARLSFVSISKMAMCLLHKPQTVLCSLPRRTRWWLRVRRW
jgi:hypothetical protein